MKTCMFCLVPVFLLTTMGSMASGADIMDGVVGVWLFDEGSGKKVGDSSDNKLHAKFDQGKPKWVKGKFGGGLEFDGESQVTVPDNKLMHLKSFTLTAWMNSPKISGKWQILASKENRGVGGNRNYGLFAHINTGVMHYSFTAGGWKSFDGKTVVTDGKWHHITTTYERPDFTLYIDGKVDAQVKPDTDPDMPENKFFIGGCNIGDYWMTGTLDDIAVFNRVLSEKEINQLMKDGLKISLDVETKEKLVTTWGRLKQVN